MGTNTWMKCRSNIEAMMQDISRKQLDTSQWHFRITVPTPGDLVYYLIFK